MILKILSLWDELELINNRTTTEFSIKLTEIDTKIDHVINKYESSDQQESNKFEDTK